MGGSDPSFEGDGGEGGGDTLLGGEGRDILIGDSGYPGPVYQNSGADVLDGGQGEDLIIAGHYLTDTQADYFTLQQAGLATDAFTDRVPTLQGALLQPGVNLFNDQQVGAAETLVDEVIGGDDLDWLIYDFPNDIDDADATELTHAVDLSPFPRL